MYAALLPLGWINSTGARHLAGSANVPWMRALPALDSGVGVVVSTGVVSVSFPQYRDALTIVTGPAVPVPVGGGITRPRITASIRPLLRRRASPNRSTQGTPPATTP